jgi:hypothetical protein
VINCKDVAGPRPRHRPTSVGPSQLKHKSVSRTREEDVNEIHLLGAEGHRLSLRIVGYQYPVVNGSEDDDWLMVEGRVARGELNWTFRDPCLTVDEVRELATWFQRVIDRETVPESLGFIEPNLHFEFVRTRWDILRVYFRLEARPPRQDPKESRSALDLWVELDASPTVLERVVAGLRQSLDSFPNRYTDAEDEEPAN